MRYKALIALILIAFLLEVPGVNASNNTQVVDPLPYPIIFVTQVPIPADFTTIGSVFGNHRATMNSAGRGGDLWIRYTDGTLRNLTAAAGYGTEGLQGAEAIAVRDPSVHWDGNKIVFSMVIGAPTRQYFADDYRWQLYEMSSFGSSETPVVSKVANQPEQYNNISPIYGTDDRIIFTTDRPRNGAAHLYPQLDEYEEAPTVSGLWSLDPADGTLRLLNHAPSGDFTPILDSFGRVLFTQWDHLQQDQQADADRDTPPGESSTYGTFNYASEAADAAMLDERTEVFPEPRGGLAELQGGLLINGHTFNHFLPWQINEDGTELETLNHIGRHELHAYLASSVGNDGNVVEYYQQFARTNPNPIQNMLQVKEDPLVAGRYIGTNAPEFETHAAGQLVRIDAAPSVNADQIQVTYITHPATADYSENPAPEHSGLYRDPLPLSDGTLIAVHTATTDRDENIGSRTKPQSKYDFRLKTLKVQSGSFWASDLPLTSGISKSISYWDPDELVTYSGLLWELQPVEVRERARPKRLVPELPAPERQIFTAADVDPHRLQEYLVENNLALIVSRDVTTRDDLDVQQPFNLRVVGDGSGETGAESIGAEGKVYDVTYMQIFQADQIRGVTFGRDTPRAGRRVLAQEMHDPAALENNILPSGSPNGSVEIAADGSVAAFVPAQRALSWQITDDAGNGIVRERNWLTFQPGEIRVCSSCHGLNEIDQTMQTEPVNQPQALRNLLDYWKTQNGGGTTPVPGAQPNRIFLPTILK